MYIGTFTNSPVDNQPLGGLGIYRAELSSSGADVALTPSVLAVSAVNPSFLVRHPNLPILYSVRETKGPDVNGSEPGAVCSFAIQNDQSLRLINIQPTGGAGTTHLTVSSNGRWLLGANYTSGTVAVFPIAESGEIRPRCQILGNCGSSVHPARQAGPHAHWVGFDPTGDSFWYVDLGLDRLFCYRWNQDQGKFIPFGALAVKPGSGPRHLVFPPLDLWKRKPGLIVVNELAATVEFLNFDPDQPTELGFCQQSLHVYEDQIRPKHGSQELQKPIKAGAGIVLTRNARFLYVSNRDNPGTVAAFAVNWMESTPLNALQIISTDGLEPRCITLDPSERFLLAGNQKTNEIVVFAVNPQTGKLSRTDARISVPQPSCMVF